MVWTAPAATAATTAPATATSTSSSTTSGQSSPLLGATTTTRFNEAFPANELHYTRSFSSGSVPSTPTSTRSRSPSISSLDTIEDVPEVEEKAALEADRVRGGISGSGGGGVLRRNSHEDPRGRMGGVVALGMGVPPGWGGAGGGRGDKVGASGGGKKRWSVCGAEKRGDLDLETIWED
ncbi:hypothetical protein LTS18_013928 [Coniosporium uncinatum]|uniref:Uncharacterized protein n=1 Tax=Coniosporium uncinatum TaxID=93489 RepID=A0ACC3DHL9_9PEZI|nr:hypothetical protein LTS18_013928 [Coniosporium uncinatum]